MADNSITVGDAMLDIFRAHGAEYIFSSPGSEWTPVWDALARAKALGNGPVFINTRHEGLAVSLANGYYYRRRKLPIVLLHGSVGPLHAAMELRSATLERIPMVVLSGESAGFGEMPGPDPGSRWMRGLGDVGGSAALVRPLVKCGHTVSSREVLPGMLQDACRQALTQPTGPVFISVPLEFLHGESPSFGKRCAPAPAATHADSSALEEIAEQLLAAKRPVLLTEYAGRDPQNVSLLVELAESLALPVIEGLAPVFMNFPRDHSLHQGFDATQLLAEADVVLLVANQTPWHPPSKTPNDAKVILIEENPSYELSPYWAFGVDIVVGGELTSSLRRLHAQVSRRKRSSRRLEKVCEERRATLEERHRRVEQSLRSQALALGKRRPMNAVWATRTIGEALPQDALVLEETVTHKGPILRHVPRSIPGTYYGCGRSTGGLGIGLGIALGLKMAEPNRLVVALMGDGAFNYNPVPAAFGFAQQFGAPIFVALMDNRGYASMKQAHQESHPEGWSVRTDTFFGVEIEPRPDYVALAQAFGGYGELVEDPETLPGAIARAVAQCEAGQLALLDLIVDPQI